MIQYLYLLATAIEPGNIPKASTDTPKIKIILGIVFGIAGALALLMIVISGLRFATAAGEPDKIAKARSGIIYALAGLAVAILAESIIFFVVDYFKNIA